MADIIVNITEEVTSVVSVGVQGPAGPAGVGSDTIDLENKAGVTVRRGQPVTLHSSGAGFVLASTTIGYQAFGVANEELASTAVGEIVTSGIVELSDWTHATGATSLTLNAKYYLSDVAGVLTTTAPTTANKVSQLVGIALSPTKLKLILNYFIKR